MINNVGPGTKCSADAVGICDLKIIVSGGDISGG